MNDLKNDPVLFSVPRGAFGLLGVLLLGGVGGVCYTPPPSAHEILPGITVLLLDADTSDPVEGATVAVTDNDTMEVLTLTTNERGFASGISKAGTYTITVEAEGYETAVVTGILVEADVRGDFAGLAEKVVKVRLTPLP